MSNVTLKVKIKSLAAEAQIIRKEENKRKRWFKGRPVDESVTARSEYECLQRHRRIDVRNEARSALLAYAYIRGRAYRSLESSRSSVPDWKRVEQLVKKFAPGYDRVRFEAWRSEEQVAAPAVIPAAAA